MNIHAINNDHGPIGLNSILTVAFIAFWTDIQSTFSTFSMPPLKLLQAYRMLYSCNAYIYGHRDIADHDVA